MNENIDPYKVESGLADDPVAVKKQEKLKQSLTGLKQRTSDQYTRRGQRKYSEAEDDPTKGNKAYIPIKQRNWLDQAEWWAKRSRQKRLDAEDGMDNYSPLYGA